MDELRASGFHALKLATELLQRARRADPLGGVWEAADVQWWWRTPRWSDKVEKLFWVDDDGPVAGVLLTSWADDVWQCDPILVPRTSGPEPGVVWRSALELADKHATSGFAIPVRDDDRLSRDLAEQAGLIASSQDSTASMAAVDRPPISQLPEGFTLVDRTQRRDVPHPMRDRNGEEVAERLGQCPLYDPALDLAIETSDGLVAGYSLYWFDPETGVGLIEPVRVEAAFQRQGLASAMLTAGIDRLATRGVRQVKVSYETEEAGALYHRIGFRRTSTTTWYRTSSGERN